jgi:hypothetical protein
MKTIIYIAIFITGSLLVYNFVIVQKPERKETVTEEIEPINVIVWQDKSLSTINNAVAYLNFHELQPLMDISFERDVFIAFGLIDEKSADNMIRLKLDRFELIRPVEPSRKGLTPLKYQEAKDKYDKAIDEYLHDSTAYIENKNEKIRVFKIKFDSLMAIPKSNWTDLYSALVLTDKLLKEAKIKGLNNNYILLVSDGMQSHFSREKSKPYTITQPATKILVNSSTLRVYSIKDQVDIEMESVSSAVDFIIKN